MSRTKCTKQTILEEQAQLKKEPFMIKVETWSYVVEPKINVNNGKIVEEKPKPQHKKSSSKKRK